MRQQDQVSRLLATWFGCGNSPIAPGTVGSLGAIPLHILLSALGPGASLLGAAAAVGLGVWAGERTAQALGEKDPQVVVIDEVAGTLIALGLCRGLGARTQVVAFLLFRLFDVTKPGIIRSIQHAKPAGVGIMADDVLAGLLAGAVARLLARL